MRIMEAIGKDAKADHLLDLATIGAMHVYKLAIPENSDVDGKSIPPVDLAGATSVTHPGSTNGANVTAQNIEPPLGSKDAVVSAARRVGFEKSLIKGFLRPAQPGLD